MSHDISKNDTAVSYVNSTARSVARLWSNLGRANMNAKAVRVKRVAEIRDGSHSIDSSRGRLVAMDIGQRKCYSRGKNKKTKQKTNGSSREKHAGSKKQGRDTTDDRKN